MKKNKMKGDFMKNLRKTMRIMRLSLFLIIISSAMAYSATSYSQSTKLTLNLNDVTVKEVIKAIEDQSEFIFFYQDKQIDLNRKVSLQVKDVTIEDLLDRLFEGTMNVYSINDRQIVIGISKQQLQENLLPLKRITHLKIQYAQQAQQKEITGKVTDIEGLPLPGVSIIVKGTTIGTVTNTDGEFSLSIPDDAEILQFSFVGMRTQEMSIRDRTALTVVMEEEVFGLEEVVAIGYGTQKRERITSSVASVKEEEFMKGAITKSPLQLLQGKIAGLAISRSAGGDPTKGVDIQLRGVNTVRGEESPLIIIDGVPGGNLNTIAPEDINSIDVLRDGSAAAIYGSRGNAGVIIITTKKGTPGELAVSYSTYAYTERWFREPRVLTGDEYRQAIIDFQNSGDPFLENLTKNMSDLGYNTDWLEVCSRDFPISNVQNFSISGGTSTTSYFASVNYRDLKGLLRESSNNQLTGRINLTHSALDDKLVAKMNISGSVIKYHPINYDAYKQMMDRNPTWPVYDDDGTYHEIQGYSRYNPLAELEQYQRDNKTTNLLASAELSYELLKGLDISALVAIDLSNGITGYYESRNAFPSVLGGYDGSASRSASHNMKNTFEPMLNYSRVFKNVHSINALAGYTYQDFSYENFSASNRGFLTDLFAYNNLGAGMFISQGKWPDPVSSNKSASKLIAYFGRVNYNYKEKYLLSASLRREGSTKFGKDNKWGLFPAISVGWSINRESFMDNFTFIDNLKLRIGYGVTGNQGIGNYISLQKLSPSAKMLYNDEWIPGYAPSSNPNPNLRWEKKAETNLGIDIAMFKNIFINIDLYDRTTTDLLYNHEVPVPPNLYNTLWTNLGEIKNQGIEFTANIKLFETSKFSWRTNFNISYNRNEVVSLSSEDYQMDYVDYQNLGGRMSLSGVYAFRLEEGEPVGNMFGWKFAGFDENGKWLFWDETNTQKINKHDVKYEDKRTIGNGVPNSWLGFSNTFRYGNFDLDMTFRGALGFDILNTQRMWWENLSIIPGYNILKSALDKPVRDDIQYSDYFVEPGDYVKLDNITLGYNVPVKKFEQLRIYASGESLLCFTKYKGPDPEMTITGLVPSYDTHYIYPGTKSYTLGIRVKF